MSAPHLPLTMPAWEARRACDLSEYGTPHHGTDLTSSYAAAQRVLCHINLTHSYLRLTPKQEGRGLVSWVVARVTLALREIPEEAARAALQEVPHE